jgi:peptidoglycan/xylan/chitin deacetylase (PgdA/CDA1 family)
MKIKSHLSSSLLSIAFCLISVVNQAQTYESAKSSDGSVFQWPEGKKMALSFSFDDARLSQPDIGIPLLDKYGVKATFYLSPGDMLKRLDAWKKAVANGHDIGNHSILHPCSGNFDWSRDKALEDYTLQKMDSELDSANRLIKKMLGVQPVSFAYPCGQTFVGRGAKARSYIPVIAAMFETGRGFLSESPNDPAFCDMSQLTGIELDGKSFEQVKSLIETARNKGLWIVFAGHEMNASGVQTSQLATIEAICKYASDPANGIWIDNIHRIAAYVKEKRGEPKFKMTPFTGKN